MNGQSERGLRFVNAGERQAHRSDYWRARSVSERLHAVLALHREGNALFKNGNPPFSYQWKLTDVRHG